MGGSCKEEHGKEDSGHKSGSTGFHERRVRNTDVNLDRRY